MYKYYFNGAEYQFFSKGLLCGNELYPADSDKRIQFIKDLLIKEYEERKAQAQRNGVGFTESQPEFKIINLEKPIAEKLNIINSQCKGLDGEQAKEIIDSVMTGTYTPQKSMKELQEENIILQNAVLELAAQISEVVEK